MKTCTFNCIHCRAGPTKNQIPQRVFIYPTEKIVAEVKHSIENEGDIDFIKYSHIGDPTLYVFFGKLNREIRAVLPDIKIATCTNCSMLNREDVFNELLEADRVIASLDSVLAQEFRTINRPLSNFQLDTILGNITRFREQFEGDFWVNTIMLKDYNDSEESLNAMKEYLNTLQPDKYLVTFEAKTPDEIISQDLKVSLVEKYVSVPFEVQIGADRP